MKLIVYVGEYLGTVPAATYHCPENYKHPWDQLRFIEDVVIHDKDREVVVIATHSPYIVDHLNSLMYAASLPEDKQVEVAAKFMRKTTAAFISADNVQAYEIVSGAPPKDIMRRDTGRIDWETFSQVSNYLGDVWYAVDDIKHKK